MYWKTTMKQASQVKQRVQGYINAYFLFSGNEASQMHTLASMQDLSLN